MSAEEGYTRLFLMDTLKGPQMTATENSAHNIRLHVLLMAVGNNARASLILSPKGQCDNLRMSTSLKGKLQRFMVH